MTTVISVENLSKTYRLGQIGTGTFTHDLAVWWARVRGKPNPLLKIGETDHGNRDGEELWALKDVSFEVEQGEVLGIIGRNGAGKSTLLKILSRVTAPTSGKIKVKGRIASLLEVGTGFHPELTGRENIYLNGAILGMTKAEVARKFDEIVDFAGVEKFIDTPVKRYSSGMYVRLAFAVAAHLDPEILVVDEVLAVGDAEFQKKCLGKMGDVAKEGRTVLFVSHNMAAVRSLCRRSILLSSGSLIEDGSSEEIITYYINRIKEHDIHTSSSVYIWDESAEHNEFKLKKLEILNSKKIPSHTFTPQEPIEILIHYRIEKPLAGLRIVIQFKTSTGVVAFTTTDHPVRKDIDLLVGDYQSVCIVPGNLMNLGEYVISIWAGIPGVKYYYQPVELMKLSIIGIGNHGSTFSDYQKWPGVVCPTLQWRISKDESKNVQFSKLNQ